MTTEPDRTEPGALPGFAWKIDEDGDWRLYVGREPPSYKLTNEIGRSVLRCGCVGWLSMMRKSGIPMVYQRQGASTASNIRFPRGTSLYDAGLYVCGQLLMSGATHQEGGT